VTRYGNNKRKIFWSPSIIFYLFSVSRIFFMMLMVWSHLQSGIQP